MDMVCLILTTDEKGAIQRLLRLVEISIAFVKNFKRAWHRLIYN